ARLALFLALGLLLVGTLLAYNERRLGRRALAAALQEGGGPWSLAEAVPPAVPDDDNAWRLLATLTNQLTSPPAPRAPSLGAGYVAPGLMRSWKEPLDWTNEAGARAGWPGLRAELEQHGPDWAVFRAALKRPDYHFPFAYTNGFYDLPQDISPLAQAARWLLAAGALAVHEGRTEDAVAYAEDLLRLVGHQRRQTLLLGQIVRSATMTHAFTLTAHLVFEGAADEPQLRRLQEAWARLEILPVLRPTLHLERVLTEQHSRIRRQDRARQREELEWSEEARELYGDSAPSHRQLWIKRHLHVPLWRVLWTDHDAARALRRWNRLMEAAAMAVNESWTAAADTLIACDVAGGRVDLDEFAGARRPGWLDKLRCPFALSGESLAPDASYVEGFFRMEALRNLAVTALAAARFRGVHAAWPESLDALAPDFLPQVPRDPMDGHSLRLRLAGGEPAIYSVGPDGKDDGGKLDEDAGEMMNPWFAGPDWVFPRMEPAE
ncbi:MAG TPA: hypothetical protein PKE47_14215, partial [Verrucomicrobiota bacterium]|nr:hypothetical protein [Verrucomicrobiota bacterium]